MDQANQTPEPTEIQAENSTTQAKLDRKNGGNGNGHGNGKRPKNDRFFEIPGWDQLTPKMKMAIPIVATHPQSMHQGIVECEKKKIVHRKTYYNTWVKNPVYVKAINYARERFFGETAAEIREKFREYAGNCARRMIEIALKGSDREAIRALENVMTPLGVEFGRGTKVTQIANITNNVERDQGEFADRLESIRTSRKSRIPNRG
jgi:hypothetical protein